VDGRALSFRLAGINNQNFIMQDVETGSWWQQASGEAILGPLKGRRLEEVVADDLTFAAWRREHPDGRVLRPDIDVAARYAPPDWEEIVAGFPAPSPDGAGAPLAPRDLVVGVLAGGGAKAYPLRALTGSSFLVDSIRDVPVLLVLDETGRSARAFDRRVDGRVLEFFARPAPGPLALVDSETGTSWDAAGRAVAGPLQGRRLGRVLSRTQFWFDWATYHPGAAIH
jgi:hypothetical protein